MKEKLWAGRSIEPTDKLLDIFNSSFLFDFELWQVDIQGSKAHVEMLAQNNIINKDDLSKIKNGLDLISQEILQNPKAWLQARHNEEDIHMAIERRLTELIGEPARKLHTARSRNDQVITDLRLWLRKENYQTCALLIDLQQTLLELAERDIMQIMPGYTHLQKAQPISLGHHWMAHYERFSRDYLRFSENYKRLNINPLGAGALAGTTYTIDRLQTTKALNFSDPCKNSLDAVSDRDFVAEHQFAAALLMVHFSQISEELILWSTDEFKFIDLDNRFATGSSMMPQKKNPDIPELVRGKTGRVLGNLQAILTVLKGLPMAYNKDLQEDKEGLFDTCKTIKICLRIMNAFLKSIKVNYKRLTEAACQGFMNATDAADYLAKKGVSFREAYYAVGQAVQYCITQNKLLIDLTEKEWKIFHELFDADLQESLSVSNCMHKRESLGGTSPTRVREEIAKAREDIEKEIELLTERKET